MSRFSLKVNVRTFLNPRRVTSAAERAARRGLSRFGAFTRTTARRSIKQPAKNAKTQSSRPGNPPKSHLGFLKNLILWAYDNARQSVVIGPLVKAGRSGVAIRALEYGGTTVLKTREGMKHAYIDERPYMRPAFLIAKERLIPQVFKDAMKR